MIWHIHPQSILSFYLSFIIPGVLSSINLLTLNEFCSFSFFSTPFFIYLLLISTLAPSPPPVHLFTTKARGHMR